MTHWGLGNTSIELILNLLKQTGVGKEQFGEFKRTHNFSHFKAFLI